MRFQFLPSALNSISNLFEFTVGVATTHFIVADALSIRDALMLMNFTGRVLKLKGVGLFSPGSVALPLLLGSTALSGPLLEESATLLKFVFRHFL